MNNSETKQKALEDFHSFTRVKIIIESAKRDMDNRYNERMRMAEKGIAHCNRIIESDEAELQLNGDANKLAPDIERMLLDPLGPLTHE